MKWSRITAITLMVLLGGMATTVGASERSDDTRELAERLTEHSDPEVRAAAYVAIGHIGTAEQQQKLEEFRLASGEGERLAAAAASIIAGKSGAGDFAAAQIIESRNSYDAVRTLSAMLSAEQIIPVLESALDEASSPDRRDIFRFLGAQTGVLNERLATYLTAGDEDVREAARQALVYTANEDSLEVANSLLNQRNSELRAQALDVSAALLMRTDLRASVVEMLESAAGDNDDGIRNRAARQLIEVNERRGAEVLLQSLADAEPESRVEILNFLLKHNVRGDLETIQPLIEEVEMADDDGRQEERILLYELAATNANNAFVDELRDHFGSTVFENRLIAVRSLGRTGRDEVSDLLIGGLGEGRSDIRRYSARGLGHIGNPSAINSLRSALTGEGDQNVRLEIVNAVGQISDPQSVQVLRFLVTDRDPELKMAVVEALDEINLPESTQGLEILLRDRDPQIKWRAFLALMRIDATQAERHVSAMLRNPPDTFANDINPYNLTRAGVEALYAPMFSHNRSRVRMVATEQAVVHRDVLLTVARNIILSQNIPAEVRSDLTHLLISEGADQDLATLERLVASFSDEPSATIAAWYLLRNASPSFEETFQELAEDEESVLGVIARLMLISIEE